MMASRRNEMLLMMFQKPLKWVRRWWMVLGDGFRDTLIQVRNSALKQKKKKRKMKWKWNKLERNRGEQISTSGSSDTFVLFILTCCAVWSIIPCACAVALVIICSQCCANAFVLAWKWATWVTCNRQRSVVTKNSLLLGHERKRVREVSKCHWKLKNNTIVVAALYNTYPSWVFVLILQCHKLQYSYKPHITITR